MPLAALVVSASADIGLLVRWAASICRQPAFNVIVFNVLAISARMHLGIVGNRFEFQSWSPDGPISQLIEKLWFARGTVPYVKETIAPTGSVVAIVVLGDPIAQASTEAIHESVTSDRGLISGPHDRPIVNRPLGETHAVGIVATPVGCEALFGIRPARLRGRVFDLLDIWPGAEALRDQLLEIDDPSSKIAAMYDVLRANADPNVPGLERCALAIQMMESDPALPVKAVAAALRISNGHLDREFSRIVGLSPRRLSNIIRMRALLQGLDVTVENEWADLALDFGWYDQAHFIRAFKRYTGVTPTRYVAAQTDAFDEGQLGDAAGFVPDFQAM